MEINPPPVAESFEFGGKTYTLQPVTLTGENVDHLNAAAHRSRVKRAMKTAQALDACRPGPDATDAEKTAFNATYNENMKPVGSFRPLSNGEMIEAIAYDPTVTADCLFRMSPQVDSLAEAERIVKVYPVFTDLSTLVAKASGVIAAGKSRVLAATLHEPNKDSGGDDQPSKGPS